MDSECGSRGWESDGTTMMKRSKYMPIFTEIDAMTVPRTVRVRRLHKMATGITKHVVTIVQKCGANGPVNFIQKMDMCAGSLP